MGRGAATMYAGSLADADCIVIQGQTANTGQSGEQRVQSGQATQSGQSGGQGQQSPAPKGPPFDALVKSLLPPNPPRRDETLQDPMCVFQIMKRHYARYTPEM